MSRVLFVGTEISREGLKGILAGSVFALIGEVKTLGEAHRWVCGAQAEDQRAQILLVDFDGRLDDDEGEMLRAIRRDQPAVKVIILGDLVSLSLLSQICPTAIDGYLLKDLSATTLMHALDLVMSGQQIFPPASHAATLGARPAQEAPICANAAGGLSAREEQILQLLLNGCSNKAMARDLNISHETVKVHMKALLRKVNARNRTQAALWAHQNGFQLHRPSLPR